MILDETPTAAEPQAQTAAQAPAAPALSLDERIAAKRAASIAKHVAAAAGTPAEAEGEEASQAAGKPAQERDAGGKFAAKGKTEEPPKGEASKEKQSEGDQATAPTLSRIRKLYSEGKVEDAVKLAFGKAPDELVGSKHFRALRHEAAEAKSKLDADRAQFETELAQARTVLTPMAKAFAALRTEDYEGFIREATGLSVNDFQKRLLGNFHKSRDPKVAELEQRIATLTQEIAQGRQQTTAQQTKEAQEQKDAAYKADIVEKLKASDDARFAKASSKQAFVNRVFEIQSEHYDKVAKTTLPLSEAAELAWEELYDFGDGGPVQSASSKSDRGAQSKTPAAAAPKKAPVNLKQSQAAEAAHRPKFKTRAERIRFYSSQASEATE